MSDQQRRELDAVLRTNLSAFSQKAFHQVNPGAEFYRNWHLETLTWHLEQCVARKIKRLIITMPPRHLKSICASVALPAWWLGRDPSCNVVCVSYSNDLAGKHARDMRSVMEVKWYKELFSATRIDRRKNTELELVTTKNGGRYATSIEGTLTGRGGDVIIIDDPIKPDAAMSDAERSRVNEWYQRTVSTRLNDSNEGVIIIVMQRLHEDDLVGHVLELDDWTVLNIPAQAEQEMTYRIGEKPHNLYVRQAGELIDPRRMNEEALDRQRRTLGTYNFSAQYQQNPIPVEGNLVKREWFRSYTSLPEREELDAVVLSWDTAAVADDLADYSVCTVWGVRGERYYVIDVVRKKLDYPDLRKLAYELIRQHAPDLVLVEHAGTGISLAQDLDKTSGLRVRSLRPKGDKTVRLSAQSSVIEQGRVYLPEQALWLDDFIKELLAFPGSKYDDQVDSVELFLRFIKSPRLGAITTDRPRSRPSGRPRPRGAPRPFNPRTYLREMVRPKSDAPSLF